MAHLYYNRTPVDSVKSLLSNFKGKTLRSPTRSTVPLLDMTIHASSKLGSIVEKCGAEKESQLHFEYEVNSGSKSARPSQTDLMVIGKFAAVAVEAKWTEAAYENVAARLSRRTGLRKNDLSVEALGLDREHQEAEVSAWIKQLQPLVIDPLTTLGMTDVVYQVVHRAASAISTGLSPSLLYLHFHDLEVRSGANADIYKTDLGNLYKKLGRPAAFRLFVATQPIERTAVFRTIEGLSRTQSSTRAAVCEAIKSGPLFTYDAPTLEQVE